MFRPQAQGLPRGRERPWWGLGWEELQQGWMLAHSTPRVLLVQQPLHCQHPLQLPHPLQRRRYQEVGLAGVVRHEAPPWWWWWWRQLKQV